MTRAKTKDADAADEIRCDAKDDDGAQCLYVRHDDSVDHAFSQDAADAAGVPSEPDVTTETPADDAEGTDAPAESEGPKEPVPASRVSVNSWWCGVCDTSSPLETKTCPKCGTPRADG